MGSKRKWQSEFSGETGTEVTRSEKPYRNVRAFPRIRMHALRRLWFAEIAAQLVHKFREIVACSMKRPAERPSGCRVTPGCAAEAQVDAAVRHGLSSRLASRVVVETMVGTAVLFLVGGLLNPEPGAGLTS